MKRKTFISELAVRVHQENADLAQVVVIFPNRRAGLFFRKALADLIDKPVIMPEVLSLEDYLLQYSPYEKIDKLEAIFELFEIYQQHQKNKETFDRFFFWGEMILRDFEEIDQYMVNTKHLFQSIKNQKELDEAFSFLDEEDLRVIQRFWSSFVPSTTPTQDLFLETWKILLPVYESYKALLASKGKAYGGMIYRDIAKQLEKGEIKTTKQLYLAGFNALTKTEEVIIKHFVRDHKAKLDWDLDGYYFYNPNQEAGYFMREYARDTILGKTFPKEIPNRYQEEKQFEAVGVPLEVGQTKALAQALEEISKSPDFVANNTVVVLPQEYMLFPTLHAIHDAIQKVNVTMGYPLKDTPVYSLLESTLALHQMRKIDELGKVAFYYKPLVEILEHPLIITIEEEKIKELTKSIRKRNRIILQFEELDFEHPLLTTIFSSQQNPIVYLEAVLTQLYAYYKQIGLDLELEYITRFYEQVKQLQQTLGKRADMLNYEFVLKLFRRLAASFKIPFTGEPLDGLQVMGILETRNLDFDRVFILNMNEDSWPAAPRRGSFIPYNIRKAFGLPVYDHQDAIYSYLFYRLIQRAKEVHFYYNTVSEFNVNGELSRLVQQLEVESGYGITKKILANDVKIKPQQAISIDKNAAVISKLMRFTAGYSGIDASRLTPSAFNIFLDCKLKFYFKYVAQLYEPDEVQEELDPMVFGNILHDTMELLYKQFMDKYKRDIVHEDDIFWIKEGVTGALNSVFKTHYHVNKKSKFKLEGRSIIAAEVLHKFINKILDYDKAYAPFKILGLEADHKDGYALDVPIASNGNAVKVRVKGIIDRIDLKDGKVRVIDYKTGRDSSDYLSLESLTDRDNTKRNKAVFQVMFYSYLFYKQYLGEYTTIEPGLFNSSELFNKNFTWNINEKEPYKTGIPLKDFTPLALDFEAQLHQLLSEIYDHTQPFDQTEDEAKCKYCPYKDICGR